MQIRSRNLQWLTITPALANIAFKNRQKNYIVSAAGADANSFNYYAKIKGKLEQQFDIGFEQVTSSAGHTFRIKRRI